MAEEKEQAAQKNNVPKTALIAGGIIVLIIVFAAGFFAGMEKTRFSYRWGENYLRNFAPERRFFSDRSYINPHGSAGQIIKIDGNNLVVKSLEGVEKNIIIANDTVIMEGRQQIKVTDLKINDNIVAIGSPNDQGQVQAKLIRVMPEMPMMQYPGAPATPTK